MHACVLLGQAKQRKLVGRTLSTSNRPNAPLRNAARQSALSLYSLAVVPITLLPMQKNSKERLLEPSAATRRKRRKERELTGKSLATIAVTRNVAQCASAGSAHRTWSSITTSSGRTPVDKVHHKGGVTPRDLLMNPFPIRPMPKAYPRHTEISVTAHFGTIYTDF